MRGGVVEVGGLGVGAVVPSVVAAAAAAAMAAGLHAAKSRFA